MAEIPGAAASHQIITPECRSGRGDEGAFVEAMLRVRTEYLSIVEGWAGKERQPTLRLVLTMERPRSDVDHANVAAFKAEGGQS